MIGFLNTHFYCLPVFLSTLACSTCLPMTFPGFPFAVRVNWATITYGPPCLANACVQRTLGVQTVLMVYLI